MDHRPFESWLLEDQPLSSKQARLLKSHLQNCMTCSALAEVNMALRNTKAVAAPAGFTERFQARLAQRLKAQRRARLLGILVLTLSGLGILVWLTWPWISTILISPAELLSSWAVSLASLWFFLRAMTEAAVVFLGVVSGFIPPYAWLMAILLFGGFSLLWVVSMRKFIPVTQGV